MGHCGGQHELRRPHQGGHRRADPLRHQHLHRHDHPQRRHAGREWKHRQQWSGDQLRRHHLPRHHGCGGYIRHLLDHDQWRRLQLDALQRERISRHGLGSNHQHGSVDLLRLADGLRLRHARGLGRRRHLRLGYLQRQQRERIFGGEFYAGCLKLRDRRRQPHGHLLLQQPQRRNHPAHLHGVKWSGVGRGNGKLEHRIHDSTHRRCHHRLYRSRGHCDQ